MGAQIPGDNAKRGVPLAGRRLALHHFLDPLHGLVERHQRVVLGSDRKLCLMSKRNLATFAFLLSASACAAAPTAGADSEHCTDIRGSGACMAELDRRYLDAEVRSGTEWVLLPIGVASPEDAA